MTNKLASGAAIATIALLGREVVARLREEDLNGQVALITGSSRGLGYILAQEFARAGCKLVICGRDEAPLQRAQRQLEEQGAEVLAVSCDVSRRGEVESLVDQATQHFGRVDILVNNAGIIQVGPLQNQRVEDFEAAQAVMFWGPLYATLAVLPQMLERGQGHIVNITSIGGRVSMPHLLPYNCAKFAATGFSEGLAAELAGQGIKVTTISPGLMRTGSALSSALVSGKQELELTWFALPASLPIISMAARRAARQIVTATKRGETVRILTLQANLLARFHGLLPGTTTNILGIVNQLLPKPDGTGATNTRAEAVDKRMNSRTLRAVTALGRSAARRYQGHEE